MGQFNCVGSKASLTRLYAAAVLTAFILSACGGGGSSTEDSVTPPTDTPSTPPPPAPAPPFEPAITLHFPPPEGFYPGSEIPVRGVVSPFEEGVTISIDGGAGAIEATVNAQGQWHADLLPLTDGNTATINATATNADGQVKTVQLSQLLRSYLRFEATQLALDTENRRMFLGDSNNQLQEYRLGDGARRTINAGTNASNTFFDLGYFPATGALLRAAQAENGDCIVLAIDAETSATQEIYRRERSGSNICQRDDLSLTASTQRAEFLVIDAHQMELITFDATGQPISVVNLDLVAAEDTTRRINIYESESDNVTFLYVSEIEFINALNLQLRTKLYSVDRVTGETALLSETDSRQYLAEVITRPALYENYLYASAESSYQQIDLQNFTIADPQWSGYVTHNMVDIIADAIGEALYVLDVYGNVSRVDVPERRIDPLFTTDPYLENDIEVLRGPPDEGQVYAYRTATSQASGSFAPIAIGWRNLYRFNIHNFTLEQAQVSSTSSPIRPELIDNVPYVMVLEEGQYTRIETATGNRTPFEPDANVIGEIQRGTVDDTGQYFVLYTTGGLFEVELSTLTMARSLPLDDDDRFLNAEDPARAAGPNAELYYSAGVSLNRVDFENQTIQLVSLPISFPDPAYIPGEFPDEYKDFLMAPNGERAWSSDSRRGNPLWEVALRGGKPALVIDSATPGGARITSSDLLSYIAASDTLLVRAALAESSDFGPKSLYAVDPNSGAHVELPVRVRTE